MSDYDYRCKCVLCVRHRRVDYITRRLRRDGDEPAADWLDRIFDHLLDVEFEVEGREHAKVCIPWLQESADDYRIVDRD